MENNSQESSLSTKTAQLKLIARDGLRMKLISPRLSEISELEARVASINDDIQDINHEVKVENYEISKLDQDHPNFEDTKKRKLDLIESLTKVIKNNEIWIEKVNIDINHQKENILKIESGDTKVSLELLNELVDKLILQESKNSLTL